MTVDEPEQQSGSRSIWSSRSRIRRKSSSGDSIGQNAGGSSSVVSLLASLSRVREFVDHDSPNDSGTDNTGDHSNKNSSSFESEARMRPRSAPTSPPARAATTTTHKHDHTRQHKHDLSASDTPDQSDQPDQPDQSDQPDPESSIPSLSLSTPPVITFNLPSASPRLSEGSNDDNNDQGHRRTPTPTNNNNSTPAASETTAPTSSESTFDFRTPLSRLRKKTAQVFFSGDESGSHNFVRRLSTRNADSQASKESNEVEPEKVSSTTTSPFGTPKLSPMQSPKRPQFFRSRSTQEELKSSSNGSSPSSEADAGTTETTGRPRSRTLGSITADSSSTVGPQSGNTIGGSNDSRRPITPSGASTGSTTPSANTLFRPSLSSLLGSRLRSTTDVHTFGNESLPRSSTTIVTPKDPMDNLVLPERIPDETVEQYLHRVKESVGIGGAVAAVLSKSGDPFHKDALKAYMDSFYFKDDPIDMALRKFLMYAKLPKETQQIDRVLEGFAASYHKANPNIFLDPETAHIVVFSLMILHTDFFNKNNKNKMQKFEFTRNTNAKCVSNDILEVSPRQQTSCPCLTRHTNNSAFTTISPIRHLFIPTRISLQ